MIKRLDAKSDTTIIFQTDSEYYWGPVLTAKSFSLPINSNCWMELETGTKRHTDTIFVYWHPAMDCKFDFNPNRIFKGVSAPGLDKLFAKLYYLSGNEYGISYMFQDWVNKYNIAFAIEDDDDIKHTLFPSKLYNYTKKVDTTENEDILYDSTFISESKKYEGTPAANYAPNWEGWNMGDPYPEKIKKGITSETDTLK